MRKDDKDGVKKYRVSYISGAAQRAALVFLLLCMGFFAAVTVLEKMKLDWAACVIFADIFIGIVLDIYLMFTSISAYKFSISQTGIIMYEPKHVYKFSWDEFIDYGIAVLDVSSPDVQNTFWIYFAKRCLRENEKCDFVRKLGKKHDYIAYFQYSPEIYGEVKQYFPAEWREQIDWELELWIENMTFTEKRINR